MAELRASSSLAQQDPASSTALTSLQDQARDYAPASKAENTLRAYRFGLADFHAWCEAHGVSWLPAAPASVALYATSLAQAGKKVATIQLRIAAIVRPTSWPALAPPPPRIPRCAPP